MPLSCFPARSSTEHTTLITFLWAMPMADARSATVYSQPVDRRRPDVAPFTHPPMEERIVEFELLLANSSD